MLAYYHYPFVQNTKMEEYTKQDLMNPQKVEELFDYCQILEGYITKLGWRLLIEYYGYEKLYEIDKRSGWLCGGGDESLEEYIACVQYEMEISPEN